MPVAAAAGLARVGGEYKIKDRLALRDRKTGTLFAGLEPARADDTARGGWPGL